MPALLGLALLAGCGKKDTAEEQPAPAAAAPAAAATPIDQSTVAGVEGTVKFAGTVPRPARIDMSKEPACQGENVSESLVVDGGNLANVFVYVKEGLGDRVYDMPNEAVITQKGCRYFPHVLGVMTMQNIKFRNDDVVAHNTHPTPHANREWNESQTPHTAPLIKTFAREEILLPVKCNLHPWMKMYINVVKSPFFAVTDKSGKYEIKGLPPGQ